MQGMFVKKKNYTLRQVISNVQKPFKGKFVNKWEIFLDSICIEYTI